MNCRDSVLVAPLLVLGFRESDFRFCIRWPVLHRPAGVRVKVALEIAGVRISDECLRAAGEFTEALDWFAVHGGKQLKRFLVVAVTKLLLN